MISQMETLHTLSVLFFTFIYCISRVLIFANGKFLKISSLYISSSKKKTAELSDIRLMTVCHVCLVMSRTRFRVNPHSIVASMSRNSLLEAGAKSEGEVTVTGLEPRTT